VHKSRERDDGRGPQRRLCGAFVSLRKCSTIRDECIFAATFWSFWVVNATVHRFTCAHRSSPRAARSAQLDATAHARAVARRLPKPERQRTRWPRSAAFRESESPSGAQEEIMKQLKVLGLVAMASFVLAACDENKRQTDQPTNNSPVTAPAPGPNNDKTSTNTGMDNTPADKKADLDKTTGQITGTTDKSDLKNNPSAMGGGPATEGSREWARDKIAQAHCDFYQGCGDIAKGKKYDDMDSCLTRKKSDLDKDYSVDKCTKIDKDRMNTCIAKIKAQKCGGIHTDPSECDDSKVCIEK